MFSEAYIMINSMIGYEDEVLKEVRKKPGVVSAERVYGVYDIIARVRADNKDSLIDRISGKDGIRNIPDLRSTVTLVSLEGFTRRKDGKAVNVKYNK